MTMEYIEVQIILPGPVTEERKEIVVSELVEIGFEGFYDAGEEIFAYLPSQAFHEEKMAAVISRHGAEYVVRTIPPRNWNALWEQSFEPVVIDNKCLIRAGFHKNTFSYPYEIIIEPKMSFGTGHHETTSLMISCMMEMDLKGKEVLDMGCGTGILAIMAEKLGASRVLGVDIDAWAYKNAMENSMLNHTTRVFFRQGDVALIKPLSFDVILANINRNVLLDDIKHYQVSLHEGGWMLLSGFYQNDMEAICREASYYQLDFCRFKEKNQWVAVLFHKKNK